MALYRITIEKAETQEDGRVKEWHKKVTITASTSYTLADDLQEWVREEIDPGAEIDYPGEDEGSEDEE